MAVLLLLVLLGCALASNPDENANIDDPDLFEGDMILTPRQLKWVMSGGDGHLGRGALKYHQWPHGVFVYTIDSQLADDSWAMRAIQGGIDEWTSKTCIRFKKRTNEEGYAKFYIGRGCSSSLGYQGNEQLISLAFGCWHKGIVAHEIGHALGFFHEQSRPDRDDYVTIVEENIKDDVKYNFRKYGRNYIDSLGVPYDYGSVMHYDAYAFSKNGNRTIVPKQKGVYIGQRSKLSDLDAQQMDLLYKDECSARPSTDLPPVTQMPTQAQTEPRTQPTTQPTTQPPTQLITHPPGCRDYDDDCPGWERYCDSNTHVKENCFKTCNRCDAMPTTNLPPVTPPPTLPPDCEDYDDDCPGWKNYCDDNTYVKENCLKTCNSC